MSYPPVNILNHQPTVSETIITAISEWCKRKHPDNTLMSCTLYERVMAELRYDHLFGCWGFYYAGMYHGIEHDGYIHT